MEFAFTRSTDWKSAALKVSALELAGIGICLLSMRAGELARSTWEASSAAATASPERPKLLGKIVRLLRPKSIS
jgi:hypothetical protein